MPHPCIAPYPRRRNDALAGLAGLTALLALAACQQPGDAPAADHAPSTASPRASADTTAPADTTASADTTDASGQVLATLDGAPIRLDEIAPRIALRLYQIEADRYSLLERETNAIIEQRLLAREAARRKLSVEALLQAEVEARRTPVTEADVDAYLAEHPGDAARGPSIRPRIAAFLAERRDIELRLALVERLRAEADVQVLLRPPERPRTDLDIGGAPARGPADAPVTLVHFARFTSAESARCAGELQKIVAAHPDRIRWVHRHFIESYDELGLRAAELSMAAQDAGRFWEFHDLIVARSGALTQGDLDEIAKRLDLAEPPADAFARVKQHLDAGVKAGVERLPVVFVNGRYFSGTFSYDILRTMIDEELAAAAEAAAGSATTTTGAAP